VVTVLDACAVGAANVRDPAAPGMVSERDVVAALVAGGDPDALWASDVMTPGLVTVSTATSIITAARLMLDVGTRHLAIADGDDIVSVVSMRDLQSALVDELLGGGGEPA
jgi:CBS domain-containing protein